MDVLALAWQDRACRGWLLGQQELWAHERRENLAARLEALATTGPDTMAPRLESLATARDEPEPAPVLWRDADGRFADAVLSVGEVALLSGEGGLGKSYVTLALAVAGALAGDLHHEYGAACGLRVTPGPVVLVSYEDSPARMFGRLRRMGKRCGGGTPAHGPPSHAAMDGGRPPGRRVTARRMVGRPVGLRSGSWGRGLW